MVDTALSQQDILVCIIERCGYKDLPCLRLVNKAFRDAVHVAAIELQPKAVFKTSQRLRALFPNATSLNFSHCDGTSVDRTRWHGSFLELCSAFSARLTRLDLRDCLWFEKDHASALLALHLPHLTSINLAQCTRMYAPSAALEGLTRQTQLQELILSGARCVQVPPNIRAVASLRKLDLSGCQNLLALPEFLEELSELRSLRAVGCQRLDTLPAALARLPALQALSLMRCDALGALPGDLFRGLTGLLSLALGISGLRALPEGLGGLAFLRSLNLRGCAELAALPSGFSRLSSLRSLDLSGCRALAAVPEGLWGLTRLQNLQLWGVGPAELPEGVSRLSALRELSWRGRLSAPAPPSWQAWPLPNGLGTLTSLETLCLTGERISALPASLGDLTGLRRLSVTGSKYLQVCHYRNT